MGALAASRKIIIPLALALGVVQTHSIAANHSRDAYVGDEACASCHQEALRSYRSTAHSSTSSLPDAHSVAGNFNLGSNTLHTSNPSLSFRMSATPDGYFETAVDEVEPSKAIELSERVDVVVGSGRKAQTYLFWKGDDLFELPVSYWTASRQWTNSPGYPDGSLHFDRPIIPRCLECHGSFFESHAPPANRYEKASLILGITCEKCHGPGREHIARKGAAGAILNPGRLSRSRQIDACALCHAGAGKPIVPALSFAVGDDLKKYLTIPKSAPDSPVDVHGNQVELLESSRCFRFSKLSCTTCHDVHKPQRDAAAFSPHCLACHKAQQCGEYAEQGARIAANCVDCHMPLEKSDVLFAQADGHELRPVVRNHRIGIYPHAKEP